METLLGLGPVARHTGRIELQCRYGVGRGIPTGMSIRFAERSNELADPRNQMPRHDILGLVPVQGYVKTLPHPIPRPLYTHAADAANIALI